MNILFVTNELPVFPGSYGGAVRQFYLIKELAKKHDVTVATIVPEHMMPLTQRLEALCHLRFKVVPSAPESVQVSDPMFYDFRLRTTPFMVWVGHHHRALIQPIIRQLLREKTFDVIVVEHSEVADWLDGLDVKLPVVLDAHNIDTLLWLRNARREPSLIKKVFFLVEAAKFWFYERKYWRRFTHILAMSDEDKRNAVTLIGIDDELLSPVPNGVDPEYFLPMKNGQEKALVYTAAMNHPPNVDGMLYFCREIFPKILARNPDLKLYIVGHSPTTAIRALARDPNIIVTGKVEDTRPYIAKATVYIVPLRSGSGTRLKILEAMSMERAIVSTSIGAEGIKYTEGKDIVIADSPADFAAAVNELLEKPERRAALGREGRKLVTTLYDWSVIAAGLQQRLEQIVSTAGNKPLKIGINLLLLPGSGKIGGVETYIRNVLSAISSCDNQNQYVLYCHTENEGMFQFSNPNFKKVVINERTLLSRIVRFAEFRLGRNIAPSALDRSVEEEHLDVMYYPYTIIFPPIRAHIPIVLTIADIQQEYYPEFFSADEMRARKAHYKPSAVRADRIIAISAYTKFTLEEKYCIPPEKIEVIHEVYSSDFVRTFPPDERLRIRKKYDLPEKFLFYPSATWPHKNHIRLLEALALIRDRAGTCPPLVLIGIPMQSQNEVRATVTRLKLEAEVRMLGYVPYEDVPVLFKLATMLVFPSLFEGFGIPVIEAFAVGTPVVCARATSLPEVAGDAAKFFDPMDVSDIARTISMVWSDPDLQDQLRKKGLARAPLFTLDMVAQRTIDVLTRTAREPRTAQFSASVPSTVFPEDIASLPSGMSEGIYEDGWIGSIAAVTLNAAGAGRMIVAGFCDPKMPHLPTRLRCFLDGIPVQEASLKGGEFRIEVPVSSRADAKAFRTISIMSDKWFRPSDYGSPDYRSLAFLFREIGFSPECSATTPKNH